MTGRASTSRVRREWNRGEIIAAILYWNIKYGRPPSAADWNVAERRGNHEARLARFYDGWWPHVNTVRHHFGSWNAAIKAAGFEPLSVGHKSWERGRDA